jgi:chorismate mutase
MSDINELRKRIDEIDEQILQSLSKRTETCRSIGSLKKKQKIPIKDIPRENDVYTHVRKKAAALGLDAAHVEAVYRQIVDMCMAVQELEEKRE